MKPKPAEQGYYPVDAIAHVCDLDPRRVQQLAREGIIPKARRGQYNLVESVRGYVRYLRASQGEPTGRSATDLDVENLRILRARATMAELELARADRSQVDVGLFRKTLARVLGSVRERLVAFATRLAPEVLGIETEEEAEAIIDRYVLELIDELRELRIDPATITAAPQPEVDP